MLALLVLCSLGAASAASLHKEKTGLRGGIDAHEAGTLIEHLNGIDIHEEVDPLQSVLQKQSQVTNTLLKATAFNGAKTLDPLQALRLLSLTDEQVAHTIQAAMPTKPRLHFTKRKHKVEVEKYVGRQIAKTEKHTTSSSNEHTEKNTRQHDVKVQSVVAAAQTVKTTRDASQHKKMDLADFLNHATAKSHGMQVHPWYAAARKSAHEEPTFVDFLKKTHEAKVVAGEKVAAMPSPKKTSEGAHSLKSVAAQGGPSDADLATWTASGPKSAALTSPSNDLLAQWAGPDALSEVKPVSMQSAPVVKRTHTAAFLQVAAAAPLSSAPQLSADLIQLQKLASEGPRSGLWDLVPENW